MKTLLFTLAAAGLALSLQAQDAEKKTPGDIFAEVPVHRLDGKSFKEAKLEKKPEFYVLYYSASW